MSQQRNLLNVYIGLRDCGFNSLFPSQFYYLFVVQMAENISLLTNMSPSHLLRSNTSVCWSAEKSAGAERRQGIFKTWAVVSGLMKRQYLAKGPRTLQLTYRTVLVPYWCTCSHGTRACKHTGEKCSPVGSFWRDPGNPLRSCVQRQRWIM